MNKNFNILVIASLLLVSCSLKSNKNDMDTQQKVKVETTLGDVVIKLYNETPNHRDNFLKLVKDGTYDETEFLRVIKDFMIQAGDPDSKGAPAGKSLGSGDLGYTIPAEIVYPELFHKKGALSAARQGDQVNPEKASSGCQFYIVTGNVYTEESIIGLENQMNESKVHEIFEELARKHMKDIYKLRKEQNEEALLNLQEELIEKAEAEAALQPQFTFTPEQIQAYTTVGGTPHLDQEYTVFGEVVEGLEIVDLIQEVETDRNDRPSADVKIIKMSIID